MKDDTTIYPIMNDLLDCVQVELTKRDINIPCKIALESGELAIADFSEKCSDQLWVRLDSGFPSTTFPQVDESVSGGTVPPMAYILEVGILRDFVPEDDGVPTDDERNQVARALLADMTAIRIAICKCLSAANRDFLLGTFSSSYLGFGTSGAWSVTVAGS